MVVGKFDLVQLFLRPVQIIEDVGAGCAVLPAEPVDDIQSRLDLFQLFGGVGKGVPGVPEAFGGILDLIHQVLHPLVKLGKTVVEPRDPSQSPFRLIHQAGRAVGVVGAIETFHALVDGVGELFRVLEDLAPGFQRVVFANLKIRPADLVDLETQGFHSTELLTLVHRQPVNLPAELGNNAKSFLINRKQLLVVCKCIQKVQMVLFVKQRRRVMLAVDVDQLDAELAQDGDAHKGAVHPANVLAVQMDLALDYGLGVVLHPLLGKPGKLRHIPEDRPNGGFACSRADHVPVGPVAQNGGDGVDDDGFARAGLAGQDVEALIEGNIRAFNDGDILNVQKTQHGASLPFYPSRLRISPQKVAAALASRMTIITVSSPASVPTTTLMFMPSMAEAAAPARPGMVFTTMILPA